MIHALIMSAPRFYRPFFDTPTTHFQYCSHIFIQKTAYLYLVEVLAGQISFFPAFLWLPVVLSDVCILEYVVR